MEQDWRGEKERGSLRNLQSSPHVSFRERSGQHKDVKHEVVLLTAVLGMGEEALVIIRLLVSLERLKSLFIHTAGVGRTNTTGFKSIRRRPWPSGMGAGLKGPGRQFEPRLRQWM